MSNPTLYLSSFHGCSKTLARARSILASFPPRTIAMTDDVGRADMILYLDDGYLGLSNLFEVKRRVTAHPSALHAVFSECDWPYPVLPGVFPSLTGHLDWADSWSFLIDLPLKAKEPSSDAEAKFLFSFLGRTSTHPTRAKLLKLDAPETPCLDLASAPGRLTGFDPLRSYVDLIDQSHFILCPRGYGASSIRIFEAMSRGRVPVIVGDTWVPPPGPRWEEFSVHIPESEVETIPQRLNALRRSAVNMSVQAAEVFKNFYAPDVFFDRLITFLWRKYGVGPAPIPGLARRAARSLGWREVRTVIHQIRSWPEPRV